MFSVHFAEMQNLLTNVLFSAKIASLWY